MIKRLITEADIYIIVKESLNNLNMKIKDRKGSIKEFSLKQENNKRLGVVLVPRVVDIEKVVSFENKNFSEVLKDVKHNKDNK